MERLRNSFAASLNREAAELVALARDAAQDPDLLDALEACLDRLRGTAESLGFPGVAEAARDAQQACAEGGVVPALARLLDASRRIDGSRTVLRPILVLVDEAELVRLKDRVGSVAAQILLVDNHSDLLDTAGREHPCALVCPAAELRLVRELLGELPHMAAVPIFVYGPERMGARAAAMREGAVGFIPSPISVPWLLAQVRERSPEPTAAPPRVLAIRMPEDDLEGALEGSGVLIRRCDGDDLLDALEAHGADLVMADLDDESAADVLAVLRGHERLGGLPVLLLARSGDGNGLRSVTQMLDRAAMYATAADVLTRPPETALLKAQVLARITMWQQSLRSRDRDPLTGALARNNVLRAIDREAGLARRGSSPMSVAIVDLDGMRSLNTRRGPGAGDRALRHMVRAVRSVLRDTDLVGRLGGDDLVAALPVCTAEQAFPRFLKAQQVFAELVSRDADLAGLSFSVGVADTSIGTTDVLSRADAALLSARLRNPAGGIGM